MAEKQKKKRRQSQFGHVMTTLFKTKKVSFVGLCILVVFLLMAIFADVIAPEKMVDGTLPSSLIHALKAPSAEHLLGTDAMGRDVLSYMIYGARTSVILGVFSTVISTIISLVLGVASAVIGGKFDLFLQRFIDAWQCIPAMLITLILMAMLGSGLTQMIIVMSIPTGIGGSRMIRGTAIGVKDSGYVQMCDLLGGGYLWKMIKHVTPNIMPVILMNLAGTLGGAIMMEATLNFLGFGVAVGTPSWGAMLTGQGRTNLYTAPWLALTPGITITLMVFASAILGDGLRDILDPRLKGGVGSYSASKTKKIAQRFAANLAADAQLSEAKKRK